MIKDDLKNACPKFNDVNYYRQPTTLLGIGLTCGALYGAITHAIPPDLCGLLVTIAAPLITNDTSTQNKIETLEKTLYADNIMNYTKDAPQTLKKDTQK